MCLSRLLSPTRVSSVRMEEVIVLSSDCGASEDDQECNETQMAPPAAVQDTRPKIRGEVKVYPSAEKSNVSSFFSHHSDMMKKKLRSSYSFFRRCAFAFSAGNVPNGYHVLRLILRDITGMRHSNWVLIPFFAKYGGAARRAKGGFRKVMS